MENLSKNPPCSTSNRPSSRTFLTSGVCHLVLCRHSSSLLLLWFLSSVCRSLSGFWSGGVGVDWPGFPFVRRSPLACCALSPLLAPLHDWSTLRRRGATSTSGLGESHKMRLWNQIHGSSAVYIYRCKYQVTALNVTRIWIRLASWLAMGGRANFSLSRLHLIPSPSRSLYKRNQIQK